jgi:hypothetical protein
MLWFDAVDVQVVVLATAVLGAVGALWGLGGMGAAYAQIGAGFLDVPDRPGRDREPGGTAAEQLLEIRQLTEARDALRRSGLHRSERRTDPRRALDDVFRRLPKHFCAEHAGDLEAVIECRVDLSEEEDCARYQIRIERERCSVRRDGTAEPSVVLSIPYEDLVAIVAQTATASRLFLRQRLTVRGDVLLAARLPSLFRMPSLEAERLLM